MGVTDWRERGLEQLRRRWQQWEDLPYPAEDYSPGTKIEGEDLGLLDGDVGVIFEWFFSGKDPAEIQPLGPVIRALESVVPHLTGPGQIYFAGALDLLRDIEEFRRGRSA